MAAATRADSQGLPSQSQRPLGAAPQLDGASGARDALAGGSSDVRCGAGGAGAPEVNLRCLEVQAEAGIAWTQAEAAACALGARLYGRHAIGKVVNLVGSRSVSPEPSHPL